MKVVQGKKSRLSEWIMSLQEWTETEIVLRRTKSEYISTALKRGWVQWVKEKPRVEEVEKEAQEQEMSISPVSIQDRTNQVRRVQGKKSPKASKHKTLSTNPHGVEKQGGSEAITRPTSPKGPGGPATEGLPATLGPSQEASLDGRRRSRRACILTGAVAFLRKKPG